jgi:glycosyltransferase involved in cell wall biosynthesis
MSDEYRTRDRSGERKENMSGADLAVVICSLNGEEGVQRCLAALFRQTIRRRLEVIVVDDGSTDGTSDVARAHGARVIRHPVNRGLAAARNSGIRAASASLVAFLDDDCEPEPEWAERLIGAYSEGVIGVGGPVLPTAPASFATGFLKRHNPLRPLELALAKSNKLSYRFYLYLKQQLTPFEPRDQRAVYALVGANMSFRRQALIDAHWFDERFRFGGEESDLCRTLASVFPTSRLIFTPNARVVHHFEPSLRDILRRSRAYGVGSARLFRKWPSMRPTFFPWPVLVLALLVSSVVFPFLAVVALTLPQLLYPSSLRMALAQRKSACLLDAYVQLAQETYGNIGFLHGLWTFRNFAPLSASQLTNLANPSSVEAELGLEKVS